jgi:hypothetical protein
MLSKSQLPLPIAFCTLGLFGPHSYLLVGREAGGGADRAPSVDRHGDLEHPCSWGGLGASFVGCPESRPECRGARLPPSATISLVVA